MPAKSFLMFIVIATAPIAGASQPPAADKGKDKAQEKVRIKSRITVGKDTTYFTEPVDRDGFVDYITALNNHLKKGVTLENNALVLIWQAIGPRPDEAPAEHFKWLGIAAPPQKGDYFINITKFAKARGLKVDNAIFDLQVELGRRPWKKDRLDHSEMADWLKANEKPLSVVVVATKRSHYFMPLVSPGTKDDPGLFISARVPTVQHCREFAAALSMRAHLHLGEGRPDQAWQDILACHRLGRHVSHGGTLIEWLVGVAIDSIARSASLSFAEHAGADSKRLKQCLSDLDALPPLGDMADIVSTGERVMFIDSVTAMQRKGTDDFLSPKKDGKQPAQNSLDLIKLNAFINAYNWDTILRIGNSWNDRMVAALRIKERGQREEQLIKLDYELRALKGAAKGSLFSMQTLQGIFDKESRSKNTANTLVALLVPAIRKVQHAGDRTEQQQRNARLAFALAMFKKDEGHYPARLADLAPKYLPSIPDDLFSGKELIYRPSKTGYLLYSVGVNGQDEQGRSSDDTPPGDDLPVRVPSVVPKSNR